MAIEPPSPTLVKLLESLKLATARDFRVCQTHIRSLVRDLPAFDSVWIDALVQGAILTPFQAKCLAQSPSSLQLGSYVLVDRLPHDNWPVRYEARPLTGGRLHALAVLPVDDADFLAAKGRLHKHVGHVHGLTHRHLCLPIAAEDHAGSLLAISSLPVGEPLDELLVRRGRFPADIVEEIARQAIDGLSRLEQLGAFHGDVRLRNILLGPAGRIILINSGLLAAVHPHVTIHGQLPIACYEGIAPELIGGRTERNSQSEMYALGCLLWQLLAGRRPYLTADRLEQLAAHQSGTIPDIRTIAPSVPLRLAQWISQLTARQPTDRFTSLTAAAAELGGSQARGRARLTQFQTSFQTMVPVRLGRAERTRKPASMQSILTAAILFGAAALFLFPGAGRAMLESAGRLLHARQESGIPEGALTPQSATNPESIAEVKTPTGPVTAELPSPGEGAIPSSPVPAETEKHSGQIVLDTVGPYAASAFSAVGELRISGAEGIRPVIEVGDTPLQLAGQRVVLDNVIIRRTKTGNPELPLLNVDSQILIATNCEFHSGTIRSTSDRDPLLHPLQIAIRWRHLNENDIQPGEIEFTNCLFAGGAAVLSCESVPQSVRLVDTLCIRTGPMCEILHAPSVRTLRMELTRSTLRETGPLLRQHQITAQRETPVVIDLHHSVLALRPDVAAIEGIGALRTRWRPQLKIESNESYLAGESAYVAIRSSADGEIDPLDPNDLEIEGLQYAEVDFFGPASPRWNNNRINRYAAAVQSEETPGIRELAAPVRSPTLPVPIRGLTPPVPPAPDDL